jgi:hypothetical protein
MVLTVASLVTLASCSDMAAEQRSTSLEAAVRLVYTRSIDQPAVGGAVSNRAFGGLVTADGVFTVGDYRDAHSGVEALINRFDHEGVLTASRIFGGSGGDGVLAAAVDAAGHLFVVGVTDSLDFPTTPGAFQELHGDRAHANRPRTDLFVCKLDRGLTVLACTLLGGPGEEDIQSPFNGNGIAVHDGHVVVVGYTQSTAFPTRNALQTRLQGEQDAIIAVLDEDLRTLELGTYLGGASIDELNGVTVLSDGSVVAVGSSMSPRFPAALDQDDTDATATEQRLQRAGRGYDGIIVKLGPFGAQPRPLALRRWRLFAGSGDDRLLGVAHGSDDAVVIAGFSDSSDLPTWRTAGPPYRGARDGIVLKLDGDLRQNPELAPDSFATYYGSDAWDMLMGVAIRASGDAIVISGHGGEPNHQPFPPLLATQTDGKLGHRGGASDAEVLLLTRAGVPLFSTYLGVPCPATCSTVFGDPGTDRGFRADFDPAGNVIVMGVCVGET